MVFSGNGADRDRRQGVHGQTATGRNANFEQVTGSVLRRARARSCSRAATFNDDDLDARQPVAIVNAAFARKHFGTRQRRSAAASARPTRTARRPGPWRTIVGVVSTVRMLGPFNNPGVDDSGFYVPFYSTPVGPLRRPTPFVSQFATVVVDAAAGPAARTRSPTALRREVAKADPNLPLYFVGTPQSQIDTFVAPNRIIATMFTIFGVVAVVLASVGIYGVMSFSVNQRTQEFGVRMALGANTGRILGMVLRQGAVQIGLGLAVGLGLALSVTRLLQSGIQNTLFGVSGTRSADLPGGRRARRGRVARRGAGPRAAGDARRSDRRAPERLTARAGGIGGGRRRGPDGRRPRGSRRRCGRARAADRSAG